MSEAKKNKPLLQAAVQGMNIQGFLMSLLFKLSYLLCAGDYCFVFQPEGSPVLLLQLLLKQLLLATKL